MESAVGCTSLDKWPSYKKKLGEYSLSRQDVAELGACLLEDGKDLFCKGMLSLSEGLDGVTNGRHSWAAVKFYYSVFYFLRCSLAAKGHAYLKNKGNFFLRIRVGESPQLRKGDRFRNDHVAVINAYGDIAGHTDTLSSNTIDGKSVYDWLMDLRHQVHYRQRCFLEPDYIVEYLAVKTAVEQSSLEALLDDYMEDSVPIFCFDAEHACVAAPIRRAMLTRLDLRTAGVQSLSEEKLDAARRALPGRLAGNCKVWSLFDA